MAISPTGSNGSTTLTGEATEPVPHPPVPTRPVTIADDPTVRAWVEADVRDATRWPSPMTDDSEIERVARHLSQLSDHDLLATLGKLDSDGTLDRLFENLHDHRAAFEPFLAELERRGLLLAHELPWKQGALGHRPPVVFEVPPDSPLPPSVRAAVADRNVLSNQDYELRNAAFASEVSAPVTGYSSHLAIDAPVSQPKLARTPEQAARFQLGTAASLRDYLGDPIHAFMADATAITRQGDLGLRVRSLETGDSAELKLAAGLTGKVKIERKAAERYEVSVSVDTLFGEKAKVDADVLGLARLEASFGLELGPTGTVKLAVSSPDEFQALLGAIKTRLSLDGIAKNADQLAAFHQAGAFITEHVVGGKLGLKSESTVGLSLSSKAGKLSLDGKRTDQAEFEVQRGADGRRVTVFREQFEAKSTLTWLAKDHERLTRLSVERQSVEGAPAGEARVKLELEDTRGARVAVRTVTWTFPEAELPLWRAALAANDKAALTKLQQRAQQTEERRTLYAEKREFGPVSSTTKRQVAGEKR